MGGASNFVHLPGVYLNGATLYLDYFGYVGTKEPLHQNKDATAQFVLFRFMVRIRN